MFLPLTFMFGIIKVVCGMNGHNELVALQMAGVSLERFVRPIFLLGAFFTCLCLGNFEFIAPKSLFFVDSFHMAHLKKGKKLEDKNIGVYLLKDNTKLVYQKKTGPNELADVFWIRSTSDIWHMKRLNLEAIPPLGFFADHLERNKKHLFEKTQSFKEQAFSQMDFSLSEAQEAKTPFETRSLSTLAFNLAKKEYSSRKERATLSAQLNYKLAASLLSLLIALSITPFCLKFSKNVPVFLISALSISGFIIFFISMDAAMILAENQALSPFFAIWAPLLTLGLFFSAHFIKQAQFFLKKNI